MTPTSIVCLYLIKKKMIFFGFCAREKWLPSIYLQDKKASNTYRPDNSMDNNDGTVIGGLASEAAAAVDEEAPLIPSARLSYVTRTQTGSFSNRWQWFTYLFGLTIIYFCPGESERGAYMCENVCFKKLRRVVFHAPLLILIPCRLDVSSRCTLFPRRGFFGEIPSGELDKLRR